MERNSILFIALVTSLVTFMANAGQEENVFEVDENTIRLTGVIDEWSAKTVEDKIKKLQNRLLNPDKINIIIDSPGGYVMAGRKIVRTIKTSSIPVVCFIDGMAASMAAFIFESCHRRLVGEDSILMFHEASGGFQGPFNIVKSRSAFVYGYVAEMENEVAKRLGMTMEQYRPLAIDELWLSGAEAVKRGGADALVKDVKCKTCGKKDDDIHIWSVPSLPLNRRGLEQIIDIYWGLEIK